MEKGVEGKCPMMKKGMMDKDMMGMEDKFAAKAHFYLENAKELGLSEEQKTKISDLKLKVKKSMTMKDAEIDVAGMDVVELMGKDEMDMNAVNTAIDRKYELKKAEAKEAAAALVELKGVLTKEQLQKAKDICGGSMMCGKMEMMGKEGEKGSMHGMKHGMMKQE